MGAGELGQHGGQDVSILQLGSEPASPETPAWELIDAGRYRPRRIRGSYRGRELG